MANVSASINRKFIRGKMPIIRRVLKEESDKFRKRLETKALNGGLWAYDYKRNYNEHSISYWRSELVTVGVGTDNRSVKAVIWNDKPMRRNSNGFNYVREIYYKDHAVKQIASSDIKDAKQDMRRTIRERLKTEGGMR